MAQSTPQKHLWAAWPAPNWLDSDWCVRDETTLRTIALGMTQRQAEAVADEHNFILDTITTSPPPSKDRKEIDARLDNLTTKLWDIENEIDSLRSRLRD